MARTAVTAYSEFRDETARRQHERAESGAARRAGFLARHRVYYDRLCDALRAVVEPGGRVLCLRSDLGQYLHGVVAKEGVGVEVSPSLVEQARAEHPEFEFRSVSTIDEHGVEGVFDYVLLIEVFDECFDVQHVLESIAANCSESARDHQATRVVITYRNAFWLPLHGMLRRLGIGRDRLPQNGLNPKAIAQALSLSGFEVLSEDRCLLVTWRIPILEKFANGVLARLPIIRRLCRIHTVVVRRRPPQEKIRDDATVSVVVPCRNERGSIEDAVRRTAAMGAATELIFCDDQSTDGTAEEVRRVQTLFPERNIRLVEGPGINKAHNVWCGFDAAENDILMILDGDLAVPPEELPRFHRALIEGRGGFINGTRLLYPMRGQAMRLANLVGNKMFSLLFSFILRQHISDTLCGTKALWRDDYLRLRSLRGTWGVDDRWGDYELIFGAAKLGLQRIDQPVHYMERTYGVTKMTGRLRNAWVMLRMCFTAFRKLR